MLSISFTLFFTIILAFIMHEMGHFLAALAFGYYLKFHNQGFHLIWDMPDIEKWKQKIIAISGFGMEFIITPIMCIIFGLIFYPVIALLHFIVYNFYVIDDNELKWINDIKVVSQIKQFLQNICNTYFV